MTVNWNNNNKTTKNMIGKFIAAAVTTFLGGLFVGIIVALLLGLPVYLLWNWVGVDVLHLPTITFFQAIGINLLCSFLFRSSKWPLDNLEPSVILNSVMPIKQNGYTRTKINQKLNRKRQEAKARQAAYDKLTVDEKVSGLVPGGSKRQRARFEKLKQSMPAVTPAKAPVAENKPAKKKAHKAKQ